MAARKTPTKTTAKTAGKATRDTPLAVRAGRTVRDRPYASAAIATGAVAAVAAAAAGAFFFRRSNKSLGQIADDVSTRVKDGLTEAQLKIKTVADRAKSRFEAERTQSEIAEEALSLKQTGTKTTIPVDPLVEDQLKAGSVAY